MANNDFTNGIKNRAATLRIRTYIMTLSILVCLVFWLFVNIAAKEKIDWVDFIVLCVVQLVIYSCYFPDGELYGTKDADFIRNKEAYNDRATRINELQQNTLLREYCKVDYERRVKTYIETECGALGISLEELEELKKLSEDEMLKLKEYTFPYKTENEERFKIVRFGKNKRKRLYKLIYEPIPVEENHPETVMSAIENNGRKALKDGSVSYKKRSFISKIFKVVVVGGVLAYIGFTARDGIGIAEIARICVYLTAIVVNAVVAYSAGETCTKVYKTRFYGDLADFIDRFNEWVEKERSN